MINLEIGSIFENMNLIKFLKTVKEKPPASSNELRDYLVHFFYLKSPNGSQLSDLKCRESITWLITT